MTVVDLLFNYGKNWQFDGEQLEYVGGEVEVVYAFDPDYLCYIDIEHKNQKS